MVLKYDPELIKMPQEGAESVERYILGVQKQVNKVNLNVAQNIIITAEDKLRLRLIEHSDNWEKKNAWIAPSGILLAIVLSFVKPGFQDILGLKAATWQAVFIIAAAIAFCWLLLSLFQLSKRETIDDLIEKIKKEPNSDS